MACTGRKGSCSIEVRRREPAADGSHGVALSAQVKIHVKDVARTGHMKDAFPLQEADQGDLLVSLSWTPVERDE